MGFLRGLGKLFGSFFSFIGDHIKEVILIVIAVFITAVLTSWYWKSDIESVAKDNKELVSRIGDSNTKLKQIEKDSKNAADLTEIEIKALQDELTRIQTDFGLLKEKEKGVAKVVYIRVPAPAPATPKVPDLDLDVGVDVDIGVGISTKSQQGTSILIEKVVKNEVMEIPVYLTDNNEVQCERLFPAFSSTLNEFVKAANRKESK